LKERKRQAKRKDGKGEGVKKGVTSERFPVKNSRIPAEKERKPTSLRTAPGSRKERKEKNSRSGIGNGVAMAGS